MKHHKQIRVGDYPEQPPPLGVDPGTGRKLGLVTWTMPASLSLVEQVRQRVLEAERMAENLPDSLDSIWCAENLPVGSVSIGCARDLILGLLKDVHAELNKIDG